MSILSIFYLITNTDVIYNSARISLESLNQANVGEYPIVVIFTHCCMYQQHVSIPLELAKEFWSL
jgi:hypothetical protein